MGTTVRARLAAFLVASWLPILCQGEQGVSAAPPRPGTPPPPGVLEGQFPPSTPSTRAAPPAKLQGAPGADQALVTRNESTAAVWVTLYRNREFYAAGCMQPKGRTVWELGGDPGSWRVRAEVSANGDCQQPITCDTSIERAAGTTSLDLEASGGHCAWRQSPGVLKATPEQVEYACSIFVGGGRLVTYNNESARGVWVTLYRNPSWWAPREIYTSGCVRPRESRTWCVTPTGEKEGDWPRPGVTQWYYDYYTRAEVIRNDGGGTCSAPKQCDTTMQVKWDRLSRDVKNPTKVAFYSNASTCWWDYGEAPPTPEPTPTPKPPPPTPTCPFNCQVWNPASKSCVGAPMNSCGPEPAPTPTPPAPAPSCPFDCQTWNPASRSCIGAPMNGCGSAPSPAPKPSCPYSCQTWNAAANRCVGAPSNACPR